MMEVVSQADGRFAVRELAGGVTNAGMDIFDSEEEAHAWMLVRSMSARHGMSLIKPGGGQGLS